MEVPISKAELDYLVTQSRAYAFVIPLTHASAEHGAYAIDSDAVGADHALALLARRRVSPRRTLDDLADSFQQVLYEEYHSLTTGQDERAATRMAEAAFALLYPKES